VFVDSYFLCCILKPNLQYINFCGVSLMAGTIYDPLVKLMYKLASLVVLGGGVPDIYIHCHLLSTSSQIAESDTIN